MSVMRRLTLLILLLVILMSAAEGSFADEVLTMDLSDSSRGLVRVRAAEGERKLKLLITYGDTVLTVDQNPDGEWQEHRLWFGSGTYMFTLYENAYGTMYAKLAEKTVDIDCAGSQNRLQPNEHVPFSEDSGIVRIAEELCGDTDDSEIMFDRIRGYVEKHFVFDYIAVYKLGRSSTEILPDIDSLLQTGMGVCKDISSAVVAMLRSRGVPSVLVYGYGDGSPHSWVVADLGGRLVRYDPTAVLTGKRVGTYRTMRMY